MEIKSPFGQQPAKPGAQAKPKKISEKEQIDQLMNRLTEDSESLGRRIRLLEEQLANLRRRVLVLDQNMLMGNKKNLNEVKSINSELMEFKKTMDELDNKLLLVIKELKLTAKKDEVDVLQKYINLWEPINFVTRTEVEKIIEDILAGKGIR